MREKEPPSPSSSVRHSSPRRPEETALYQCVAEYWPEFTFPWGVRAVLGHDPNTLFFVTSLVGALYPSEARERRSGRNTTALNQQSGRTGSTTLGRPHWVERIGIARPAVSLRLNTTIQGVITWQKL